MVRQVIFSELKDRPTCCFECFVASPVAKYLFLLKVMAAVVLYRYSPIAEAQVRGRGERVARPELYLQLRFGNTSVQHRQAE